MGGSQGKPDIDSLLNEAITTEYKDVQLVNHLLNVKLRIPNNEDTKASSKLDFFPLKILDKNIDFNLLIEILDKIFQICKDKEKFLGWLVDYVNDFNKTPLNRVKVLNYVIVISVKNNLNPYLQLKLQPEFFFTSMTTTDSELCRLAYQAFISYFKLCDKSTKVNFINAAYKYCQQHNNLDLICALLNHINSEFFFTENCCLSKDCLWIFIESYISGDISHLQKQGIQILTKYVFSNTTLSKDIFLPSDTETAWQAFFLLIDVGREKQLHLVEPSLNLLKHLKYLPFLWQTCCYKIFLQHSQLTIVYKVAIDIFNRVFDNQDQLIGILKLVLPAINKHEYSPLFCKLYDTLAKFCDSLSPEHFQIVLEEIIAMHSWNSVSFWKVIKSVLTNIDDKKKHVPLEVIDKMLIYANNLTHLYIRNESIKFIVASFWDETNHSKMFNITKNLIKYKNTFSINYYFRSKIKLDKIFFNGQWDELDQNVWFSILQDSISNNWTKFQSNYATLSPCLKLLMWRDYLLKFREAENCQYANDIESFLLNYFQQNLQLDNTKHVFITVFKMLFLKWPMNDLMFTEVIRNPLFNPELYTQNQLHVALVLVQQYLFTSHRGSNTSIYCKSYQPNMRIFFKTGSRGNLFICFSNIDDNAKRSSIRVDNAMTGIECVNCIYKLASRRTFTVEVTEKTIEQFNILLESQTNEVVQHIYSKTYDIILKISQSPDMVKSLLYNFITNNLYKNLLNLKRDQYYKDIVTKFTNIVCTSNFIEYNKDDLTLIFNTLLNISLQCPQIRLNFTKKLSGVVNTKNIFYIKLIIELYLQGVTVTKDERTEFSLCQEFMNDSVFVDVNQIPADRINPNAFGVTARFWALKTLITLGETYPDTVINCLTSRYLEDFKKRYFQDSKIHFEKLRLVQAILLITVHANLSISEKEEIHSSFTLKCIEQESNQHCVTQLLNLILIVTLNEPTTVISWIKALDPAPPTVIANLMPTLFHLTLLSNEDSFENTIKLILPWTMGPQFKLRVFAQYCIKQLLYHSSKREYVNVISKFSYLEDVINICLTASEDSFANTLKTDILLLRDFDPLRDLLWSVILYDIPRLNQVHPTEWQNMQVTLRHIRKLGQKFDIPSLSKFSCFTEAVDTYLEKNKNNNNTEPEPIQAEISQIQKKIIPWKSALENDNEPKNCDFILVASLIDKPQNLGGLSRTCEVFGINRIVFDDAKIVTDKEFKSLSMSSESWIKPIEVKVKDLWDYIITLRKDEYSLIGAEQTPGSKKLNNFSFPKKMALVLGNEKTGIPPELIPLLDSCVEIPQFGQTRSLNVHVAGATFIWEYAKQHLID